MTRPGTTATVGLVSTSVVFALVVAALFAGLVFWGGDDLSTGEVVAILVILAVPQGAGFFLERRPVPRARVPWLVAGTAIALGVVGVLADLGWVASALALLAAWSVWLANARGLRSRSIAGSQRQ